MANHINEQQPEDSQWLVIRVSDQKDSEAV